MKRLQVTPDDYKTVFDSQFDFTDIAIYYKAQLYVTDDLGNWHGNFHSVHNLVILGWLSDPTKDNLITFFKRTEDGLEQIDRPEGVLPKDSIRLKDCKGHHVITGEYTFDTHGESPICKICVYQGLWVAIDSKGNITHSCMFLLDLVGLVDITNIKVYDPTCM